MNREEMFQDFVDYLNEPKVNEITLYLQNTDVSVAKSELTYKLLPMKEVELKDWFNGFVDELVKLYKEFCSIPLDKCVYFIKVKYYE